VDLINTLSGNGILLILLLRNYSEVLFLLSVMKNFIFRSWSFLWSF